MVTLEKSILPLPHSVAPSLETSVLNVPFVLLFLVLVTFQKSSAWLFIL